MNDIIFDIFPADTNDVTTAKTCVKKNINLYTLMGKTNIDHIFSISSSVHSRKPSTLKNFGGFKLKVEFLFKRALSTAKLQSPFKTV